MIEHLVLLQWKEETSEEERTSILQDLGALKHKILGIVSFKVGHNESARSQGYHAAISSTFVDRASLQAYGPHPEHQKVVVSRLNPAAVKVLVLDFEPLAID